MTVRFSRLLIAPLLAALALVSGCGGGSGATSSSTESGATVVGARKFLVAYNVNLNTLDKRLANRVAFDIRERGRMKRDADGNPVLDKKGEPAWEPGLLKSVKAVGWVIPEYGCAQVSINLTDLDVTPLHLAFDTCEERARERGLRVTGSEIVGLVPLSVLLEAGRHYLRRMGRPTGVPASVLVQTAIRTLGLSDVKPFDPKERVIEYRLASHSSRLARARGQDPREPHRPLPRPAARAHVGDGSDRRAGRHSIGGDHRP